MKKTIETTATATLTAIGKKVSTTTAHVSIGTPTFTKPIYDKVSVPLSDCKDFPEWVAFNKIHYALAYTLVRSLVAKGNESLRPILEKQEKPFSFDDLSHECFLSLLVWYGSNLPCFESDGVTLNNEMVRQAYKDMSNTLYTQHTKILRKAHKAIETMDVSQFSASDWDLYSSFIEYRWNNNRLSTDCILFIESLTDTEKSVLKQRLAGVAWKKVTCKGCWDTHRRNLQKKFSVYVGVVNCGKWVSLIA